MSRRIYLAGVLLLSLLLGTGPAAAIKLSPAVEQLYSSVEMEPPSATHMTVCYGFVCRLRLTLVFTDAERTSITNMMNKGRASPAEERKAIQQVFVWFDHRVAPRRRHQQAHRQCGRAFVRRQPQLRLLGHDAERGKPAAGAAGMGRDAPSPGVRSALSRQHPRRPVAAQHGGHQGNRSGRDELGRRHVAHGVWRRSPT